MPRMSRIVIPQLAHHVTQRGHAGGDVFFSSQDYQVYLRLLKQYSSRHEVQILGFCVMPNHVNLVMVPDEEDSLGKTMRDVNGFYARYRSAIKPGQGPMWHNGFFSYAFERTFLSDVISYVELDPVRAGIVRSAEDYMWSSAPIHVGGPDRLRLLHLESWRTDWTPDQWAQRLRQGVTQEAAIMRAAHSGRVLGSDQFVAELERRLKRRLSPGRPGRPKKERQSVVQV